MLCRARRLVLELTMKTSLSQTLHVAKPVRQRLLVSTAICATCFLVVVPLASAQSQTTHFRSYSSTHYKSAPHFHSVDQKPRSVPSVGPDVTGKASGKAATTPNKELDQLERASLLKPATVKRGAVPASTKGTLTPEKHSAPINFTHRELPQTAHSGAVKVH